MNLILFAAEEIVRPLPRSDARARHLLQVLRRKPGETFDAGLIDGPRGKGTLVAVAAQGLDLAFQWGQPSPPPDPITLLLGLPRPQTARDILRDATTLGVSALHFFPADKGDPGYARSSLWKNHSWHRQLIIGAEQACDTRLPAVSHGLPLPDLLDALPAGQVRFALDNYEAAAPFSQCRIMSGASVALAFGPERGWSAGERMLLRARGFDLVHLGPRVLRTETAVVAALALLKARLGSL